MSPISFLILRSILPQRRQRIFDQLASEFFFFIGRHVRVTDDVHDAVAEHYAVGTDHFCYRQCRSDLHRRDAGLFQFRRNRSAAASAGASSRR